MDYFKTQRAFSIAGQDCLGSSGLDVRDFKEAQSVSEFDGKRFMSEILGVAGWQQTPALMKQVANAVTAWGVSHVIPHGVFLDRELTSIPFPSDWYNENPYWNHLDLWNDFMRRASFVNSYGHLVPDVLLVNPMDSVWIHTSPATFDPKLTNFDHPVLFFDLSNWVTDEVKAIEKVYSEAIDSLTNSRTEYLIADRYYINSMTVSDGAALSVGDFSFKVVVLPRLTVLPLKVAEKLLSFAQAGGLLLYLDQLPQGSTDNGMNDPAMMRIVEELASLPNVKHCSVQEIPETIALTLPPQVAFEEGEFSMLQSHRRIDGRDYFWLANNLEEPKSSRLRLRDVQGQCSIWNCENGEMRPVASESLPDGGTLIDVTFEPYEAFWLVVDPEIQPLDDQPAPSPSQMPTKELDGPWHVRVDCSAQNPLTPEIVAFYCVDWAASWLDVSKNHFLRYSFSLPDNPIDGRLMITSDEDFRLWVNGQPIKNRFSDDLWSQVSIYDVTQYLQAGNNVIAVDASKSRGLIFQGTAQLIDDRKVEFHSNGTVQSASEESENWFLPRFNSSDWKPVTVLGPPPIEPWIDVPEQFLTSSGTEMALAPWSEWGLDDFSGFIDYEKTFDIDSVTGTEVLDLGHVKYMAEVWVNGEPVGRRLWPPFKFSIGEALKIGENTVRVRVGNLLANVMNEFDKKGKLRKTFGMEETTQEQLESGLFGPAIVVRSLDTH